MSDGARAAVVGGLIILYALWLVAFLLSAGFMKERICAYISGVRMKKKKKKKIHGPTPASK